MAQKGRLNPNDSRPPVRQVADALRAAYKPGAKLPHTDELVAQWHVSVTVVRRAVAMLRDEGLVVSTPGVGTFYVAERPADPEPDETGDTPAGLAAELAALAKRVAKLDRK